MNYLTLFVGIIILIILYVLIIKPNTNSENYQKMDIDARNAQTEAIKRDKKIKELEKEYIKKRIQEEEYASDWIKRANKLLRKNRQKFYTLDMIASELGGTVPYMYQVKNREQEISFLSALNRVDDSFVSEKRFYTYTDGKNVVYYYYGKKYESW